MTMFHGIEAVKYDKWADWSGDLRKAARSEGHSITIIRNPDTHNSHGYFCMRCDRIIAVSSDGGRNLKHMLVNHEQGECVLNEGQILIIKMETKPCRFFREKDPRKTFRLALR